MYVCRPLHLQIGDLYCTFPCLINAHVKKQMVALPIQYMDNNKIVPSARTQSSNMWLLLVYQIFWICTISTKENANCPLHEWAGSKSTLIKNYFVNVVSCIAKPVDNTGNFLDHPSVWANLENNRECTDFGFSPISTHLRRATSERNQSKQVKCIWSHYSMTA